MKPSALIFALVLLAPSAAYSQTQADGSPATGGDRVTGIFEGLDVGGPKRKSPVKKTRSHSQAPDSFAINPAAGVEPRGGDGGDPARAQARQQMIPVVEAPAVRSFPRTGSADSAVEVPPGYQAAPGSQIANTLNAARNITGALPVAPGGSSPGYLKGLVNQVKSAPGSRPPVIPKHSVDEGNRF